MSEQANVSGHNDDWARSSANGENHAVEVRRRRLKVLLVEDSTIDQRLVSLLLKQARDTEFDVVTASSCDEAFEEFRRQRFDLAILDFWLGNETAVSLIRRISLAGPCDLPFVLVSGTDIDAVDHMGLDCGLRFVSKFDLTAKTLQNAVVEAIEMSRRSSGPMRAV